MKRVRSMNAIAKFENLKGLGAEEFADLQSKFSTTKIKVDYKTIGIYTNNIYDLLR